MTTWTTDAKPSVRPTIWTLDQEIWNDENVSEYIEFPWQREANNIWTNDTKAS